MTKLLAALPDAMIVAGVGAVAYGAGIIHPAAGYIVGGLLAGALGVLASVKQSAKAGQ